MTSKRLFLRGLREDIRHKVWMLVLSLLGSFLAMPVLWLLYYTDMNIRNTTWYLKNMTSQEQAQAISETVGYVVRFFREDLILSTGVIAIVGAVIVGLECFRYLQQKSMVDTYHSLPVSRMQIFAIKYVNGLLIWLVPYLLCMILTLVICSVQLAPIGGMEGIPALIREAAVDTAVLMVAYMLIYHLMLLATMLTGNMLNTLAMASILGCGVIIAYGLGLGFMRTYFSTYYPQGRGIQAALYASPIAAPVYLLSCRVDEEVSALGFPVMPTLICLGVALALGGLTLFVYSKRPSERAGRGVDMKGLAGILRTCVSVLGGMGGWLFMNSLIDHIAWSVFGALLVGILAYGVLDVIFSMDFKAFFRHKYGMAASMALTLLISFGYRGDWMGYDRYLPQQEDIQKVSIACSPYSINRNWPEILEGVELTDASQIHAFLERGIENVVGQRHTSEKALIEVAYGEYVYKTDAFYVEVTLASGWSYFRTYPYYRWDEDVVLPLLCSEEYARGAYCLSEDVIDICYNMRFVSDSGIDGGVFETKDEKILREVAEAYNQDLLGQPEVIIRGEDRLLGQVYVQIRQVNGYTQTLTLDIYEGMTHTLAAMERGGIRIFNQPVEAKDVESITFKVDGSRYGYRGDASISFVERGIRGWFGVYPDSGYEPHPDMASDSEESGQLAEESSTYTFVVTAPEEVEELLELIQYCKKSRNGVFAKGMVSDVIIQDDYGTEWTVSVRRGALPEKYIQRFLEEAEAQR